MKITIEEIGREREEELILKCYQLNDDILNLLKSIKAAQNGLVGMRGEEIHRLSLADIYYFEVVDSRSFFYCRDAVYESRMKCPGERLSFARQNPWFLTRIRSTALRLPCRDASRLGFLIRKR